MERANVFCYFRRGLSTTVWNGWLSSSNMEQLGLKRRGGIKQRSDLTRGGRQPRIISTAADAADRQGGQLRGDEGGAFLLRLPMESQEI